MSRVALLSFSLLALAPRPAVGQQAPHDSIVGAVQAVDMSARTVEITGGVGMALRQVRLVVPATVPVKSGAASTTLEQLHPGDVVRVTFGGRTGDYTAYTVEVLGTMTTGRAVP
jgi:hypothetical protein